MQETDQKPKPRVLIPAGFRFQPTDEELVLHYLYNKVTGKPLPYDGVVKECDLYGTLEPWEIWDLYGGPDLKHNENSLYFFTKLKKRSANDSRYCRKVGCNGGTWKGGDTTVDIKARRTKERIAIKKRFRYDNGGSMHNGRWIMHEFSLDPSLLPNTQADDYALCRVKKKDSSSDRRRKFQTEEEKIIFDSSESPELVIISNDQHMESKGFMVSQALPNIEAEKREIVLACAASVRSKSWEMTPDMRPVGTKSSTKGQPNATEQVLDPSIPPIKSANQKLPTVKLNQPYEVEEKGVNNINEQESIMPRSTLALIANSEQLPSLANDCATLVEIPSLEDTYLSEQERYTDWAKCFAEELLQDQPPQLVKETPIEMLPNKYDEEKWFELMQDQPPQLIKQGDEIEMLPNKFHEEKWLDWKLLP